MGKPRIDPLDEVSWRCADCGHQWSGAPETVTEAPDCSWHPWRYECACPECSGAGEISPQQRGLLKAWANATGPKTPEGKARSASNLDGHPTPEESRITRFNAVKHGMDARVATYFPARPGKYPHCETCPYFDAECKPYPPAGHQNPRACLRRTELYMKHQIAFSEGDPKMLTSLRADTHAGLQAILDDMLIAVIADGGPRQKTPAWYYDKDGGFHLAGWYEAPSHSPGRRCECGTKVPHEDEVCKDCGSWMGASTYHQIYELKEHPLLKPLMQFIDKLGLSLADMGMTPKVQEEQDAMEGHLAGQKQQQDEAGDYQRRQTEALEQLSGFIERSRQRRDQDPVVIEHKQEEGS